MKYVVFYASAADVAHRAPAHFAAHRAWYEAFRTRGDLLMLGTFGDPQKDGSMAIFRTRDAAEEFAAGDPFVVHGVVSGYEIRDWNEILT